MNCSSYWLSDRNWLSTAKRCCNILTREKSGFWGWGWGWGIWRPSWSELNEYLQYMKCHKINTIKNVGVQSSLPAPSLQLGWTTHRQQPLAFCQVQAVRAEQIRFFIGVLRRPCVFVWLFRGSFQEPSKNCEKRLLAASCLSIYPSVRMEKLGSHWTDFHEICYLKIFRKVC